jgi:hypothetical protein
VPLQLLYSFQIQCHTSCKFLYSSCGGSSLMPQQQRHALLRLLTSRSCQAHPMHVPSADVHSRVCRCCDRAWLCARVHCNCALSSRSARRPCKLSILRRWRKLCLPRIVAIPSTPSVTGLPSHLHKRRDKDCAGAAQRPRVPDIRRWRLADSTGSSSTAALESRNFWLSFANLAAKHPCK